jgi:hypothetical protein
MDVEQLRRKGGLEGTVGTQGSFCLPNRPGCGGARRTIFSDWGPVHRRGGFRRSDWEAREGAPL